MRENQIYELIQQYLIAESPARGLLSEYLLRYQPTQQGRNTDRSVYMHLINTKRYGFRAIEQKYVAGLLVTRTETQAVETTLQFSVTQPPSIEPADLTSSDVLNLVASTIQGPDAIAFFIANGASLLRVTDIRNTFVRNDRDQFEPNPTFDVVVKHDNVFVDGVPVVTEFEFRAIPVPNLA